MKQKTSWLLRNCIKQQLKNDIKIFGNKKALLRCIYITDSKKIMSWAENRRALIEFISLNSLMAISFDNKHRKIVADDFNNFRGFNELEDFTEENIRSIDDFGVEQMGI